MSMPGTGETYRKFDDIVVLAAPEQNPDHRPFRRAAPDDVTETGGNEFVRDQAQGYGGLDVARKRLGIDIDRDGFLEQGCQTGADFPQMTGEIDRDPVAETLQLFMDAAQHANALCDEIELVPQSRIGAPDFQVEKPDDGLKIVADPMMDFEDQALAFSQTPFKFLPGKLQGLLRFDLLRNVVLVSDIIGQHADFVEDRADVQLVPEGPAILAVVQQFRADGANLIDGVADTVGGLSVGFRSTQEAAVASRISSRP